MRIIETTAAPGAIGPYSQGCASNGLVFTSGQIPVDPATGAVVERHPGGDRGPGREKLPQCRRDPDSRGQRL